MNKQRHLQQLKQQAQHQQQADQQQQQPSPAQQKHLQVVAATFIPLTQKHQQQQQHQPPSNGTCAASQKQQKEAEDANSLLYQALMKHKQLEQQRVTSILRDTRCITDAMLQKQKDAQQSRLVVSAVGEQYVNNARYVQINSGLEPKIQVNVHMDACTQTCRQSLCMQHACRGECLISLFFGAGISSDASADT